MQIERKYAIPLLFLLALIALAFTSWPAEQGALNVSKATTNEIAYNGTFRNWSFEDQVALAEALQEIAAGEVPDTDSMPENVQGYILELSETVRSIKENNRTDVQIKNLDEILASENFKSWSFQEKEDFVRVVGDTREKKKSDFSVKAQKVVIAYVEFIKNLLLEDASKNMNKTGTLKIPVLV